MTSLIITYTGDVGHKTPLAAVVSTIGLWWIGVLALIIWTTDLVFQEFSPILLSIRKGKLIRFVLSDSQTSHYLWGGGYKIEKLRV